MINFRSLVQKFPSVWPTYWNNQWTKGTVKYVTNTGEQAIDVRTLLYDDEPQIEKVASQMRGVSTDDEVALRILKWTYGNIAYISDKKKHGRPEYWQTPTQTFNFKTGDCEDGAIFIMKMMEYAGIPSWRRKICCGFVETASGLVGHGYVIYLADDFEWYVIDWCYWPLNSAGSFLKVPHRKRPEYKQIWFTFNEEFVWPSQKDTLPKNWRVNIMGCGGKTKRK